MRTQFLACRQSKLKYVDRWLKVCALWIYGSERFESQRNKSVRVSERLEFQFLPVCCALSGGSSGWWWDRYSYETASVSMTVHVSGHTFASLPWDLRQSIWTVRWRGREFDRHTRLITQGVVTSFSAGAVSAGETMSSAFWADLGAAWALMGLTKPGSKTLSRATQLWQLRLPNADLRMKYRQWSQSPLWGAGTAMGELDGTCQSLAVSVAIYGLSHDSCCLDDGEPFYSIYLFMCLCYVK